MMALRLTEGDADAAVNILLEKPRWNGRFEVEDLDVDAGETEAGQVFVLLRPLGVPVGKAVRPTFLTFHHKAPSALVMAGP